MVATCVGCSAQIGVDHVTHTIPVPNAPHHIALVYECPYCMRSGRIAAEREAWENLKYQHTQEDAELRRIMVGARIELDAIDTVSDLEALWASYKPAPMMEIDSHRGCGCRECKARRYL